jgi:hypothetical protein
MIVAVGVLIAAATIVAPATPTLDPQHLPALPAQGFAVSSGAALAFVELQGRVIGRTEGFRFASENTFGAGMPRFTDSGGLLWRLDRAGRPSPRQTTDSSCTEAQRFRSWRAPARGWCAVTVAF